MTRVLVTCPPMVRQIHAFRDRFETLGWDVTTPPVVQTLSESELIGIVPGHDGWIIGDDPATRAVFETGARGRLRAAVKWGIGIDNVDFEAARAFGIPVANTPGMFGAEVADLALSYIIALARETFGIDRGVRAGEWPKPSGISLAGRTLGLIGLGDIGRNLAHRALACGMKVVGYDPAMPALPDVETALWPERIAEADFLTFACALTPSSRHMLDASALAAAKDGVRIVNVARGALIDEAALIEALRCGKAHSAALDVFETEPLSGSSALRGFERCIFGSHNGSNTLDGVMRASGQAIDILAGFLAR